MKLPFRVINSEFSKEELREMFDYYLNNLEWSQDEYNFGDKTIRPRRKTFMFGKNYSYSGQTKEAVPFDDFTNKIKNHLESVLGLEKNYFNGCLLNLYIDGEASISYHKDDETDMIEDAIIIALSLGSTRKFYFQNDDKTMENRTQKLEISDGELLIMEPECQKTWKHAIPKEKGVTDARISLTFRRFNEEESPAELLEF